MSTDHPLTLRQPPRSRVLTHWQRHRRRWGLGISDEAGLTLIECLAAIVVVGFIGAAIAPVLVLSVATRVQSQKAEQALALAQSEIDFVRTRVEQGGAIDPATDLPPEVTGLANNAVVDALSPNAKPPNATKDERYPAAYRTVRLVDIDEDGDDDFGIQVYRTETAGSAEAPAFSIGVRVYDIQAIDNALANLDTQQASIGLTSGQGDRGEQPLATLYTTVASGEDTESLCSFVDFLDFEANHSDYQKPTGCTVP